MAAPKKDISVTLNAGENALGHGDIQSALDAIDELDRLDPVPEAAHRLASRIAAAQDDPVEAIRRLDLALDTAAVTTVPDEACLNFHKQRRAAMTPSFDQVDKPITDAAIGRWQSIESRLGTVLEAFPVA